MAVNFNSKISNSYSCSLPDAERQVGSPDAKNVAQKSTGWLKNQPAARTRFETAGLLPVATGATPLPAADGFAEIDPRVMATATRLTQPMMLANTEANSPLSVPKGFVPAQVQVDTGTTNVVFKGAYVYDNDLNDASKLGIEKPLPAVFELTKNTFGAISAGTISLNVDGKQVVIDIPSEEAVLSLEEFKPNACNPAPNLANQDAYKRAVALIVTRELKSQLGEGYSISKFHSGARVTLNDHTDSRDRYFFGVFKTQP